MIHGNMTSPAGRSKSGIKRLIKKLDPSLRDEFLRDGQKEERSAHIQKTEDGKFKINLYLSQQDGVDGKYESANADKEFTTYEEADGFVEKFFNDNPEKSNYSELEE